MTAIIIPRRRLVQPQGRLTVEPTANLSAALVGEREIIRATQLVRVNGGGVAAYPQGAGLQFAKALQQHASRFPAGSDWSKYSIVAQVYCTGTDSSYSNVFNAYTDGFAGKVQLRHTATNWDFYHHATPLNNWRLAQGAYVQARVQTLVCTFDGAVIALYIDGFLVSQTDAVGYAAGAPNALTIGSDFNENSPVNGTYFDGVIGLFGLSNGVAWDRRYAERVSGDPWGELFCADPLRIYSLPSGAITLNSLTMSNITQTTARATLGLTR